MTTYAHVQSSSVIRSPFGVQISWVLTAAFTLSVVHTVYSYLVGIEDPRFTVTTPVAYVFYAVGFASAWLARRPEGWARWTLLGYLAVLLVVSVFFYPTTFRVDQQTTFGWFENDVYTGLLMIATYLAVLGLAGPRRVER
ncbi:hypothetical protein ACIB24_00225 [Spongisporangium articulatum]|uniref:Integral membrane protein n=1 Tax=Spongisporangium articulatum TaxID=3362603 RepID=A0ABW8AGL3_9ACTN